MTSPEETRPVVPAQRTASPAPGRPDGDTTPGETPLIKVDHLEVHFPIRRGVIVQRAIAHVRAVDDVSFTLAEQETLGLVGESGCGKSTLARCLVRLATPTGGSIQFRGRNLASMKGPALSDLRRDVQMVFQDPQASLNPRKRVEQIIAAGLRLRDVPHALQRQQVAELLGQVGLSPEHINRFPHEFSGGQRQRIGIARALAVRPSLLVLDEPVSALDVSVQAQVINLLSDLQEELRLAYVFVAHNLAVVRHVSDRIAVMYLGKIVELSPGDELYDNPIHPYTAALLEAVPVPEVRADGPPPPLMRGEPANPISPPSGCRFHPRCPLATDVCREVEPSLTSYGGGHLAACHHPLTSGAVAADAATPQAGAAAAGVPPADH
jgi:oligopeptide/dipeptide ABC transporter ATP-binding protein